MDVPVLIYDGRCKFCRSQASRLLAWTGARLKLESFHDAGVLERYGLTQKACEQAMQLVSNGRIYSGAQAAAEALRVNPTLAWLAPIYYVPGIRQIANGVYRWVARHRGRF